MCVVILSSWSLVFHFLLYPQITLAFSILGLILFVGIYGLWNISSKFLFLNILFILELLLDSAYSNN